MGIYRQATAPAYEADGLWFDSDDNDKPYYGTGGSWVALNPGSLFTDFSDTDHVQDADVLLGQRGAGGVNYQGSTFLTKNPAGNAGLGATPFAWTGRAFDVGTWSSFADGSAFGTMLGYNCYYDGSWKYKVASVAARYDQGAGHKWFTAPTGNPNDPISFVQAMTLNINGNLSIGTTNDGGHRLFLVGSSPILGLQRTDTNGILAYFYNSSLGAVGTISVTSTATSYNTSSDHRLKDEIASIANSGEFIDALKPRKGIWKEDGSPFAGFLAHEFAEVSPSSVAGEKDAEDEDGQPIYQSMQASSPEVMANIIAELQSLRRRVAELEARQ